MDNRLYGASQDAAADPAAEQARALGELLRVTSPGGRVLVTVPYGRSEDHGWFRQYDESALSSMLDGLAATISVYAYGGDGWRVDSLSGAADAQFKDHHADKSPAPDRAAAARAVTCVEIRRA
jgi:hypothetical protein